MYPMSLFSTLRPRHGFATLIFCFLACAQPYDPDEKDAGSGKGKQGRR